MYTTLKIHGNYENALKTFDFACQLGLIQKIIVCKSCKKEMKLITKLTTNELKWRCKTKKCGKRKVSIRNGSEFFNIKTYIRDIIRVFYEWSKNTKLKRIREELGGKYDTINTILKIIRKKIR